MVIKVTVCELKTKLPEAKNNVYGVETEIYVFIMNVLKIKLKGIYKFKMRGLKN